MLNVNDHEQHANKRDSGLNVMLSTCNGDISSAHLQDELVVALQGDLLLDGAVLGQSSSMLQDGSGLAEVVGAHAVQHAH